MIANEPTITIRFGGVEISISSAPNSAVSVFSGPSELREIWPAELVERVEVDLLREDQAWERTSRWR